MPTYEYECSSCHLISQHFSSMDDRPDKIKCPQCSGVAKRIVSYFASQDEHPVWLDSNLRNSIQDGSDRPIETRSELNKFCKERGIVENSKKA